MEGDNQEGKYIWILKLDKNMIKTVKREVKSVYFLGQTSEQWEEEGKNEILFCKEEKEEENRSRKIRKGIHICKWFIGLN